MTLIAMYPPDGWMMPQSRPRMGKHGVYSNASATLTRWRRWLAENITQHVPDRFEAGVPVSLYIRFQFVRPASHYNSKGVLRAGALTFPPNGDIDNLYKAVADEMEKAGVVHNDSQIVHTNAAKEYVTDDGTLRVKPCLVIGISPWDAVASEERRP